MYRESTRLEVPGGWCGRNLEGRDTFPVSCFLESLGSNGNTSTALVSSQCTSKDAITVQFIGQGLDDLEV